MGTERLSRIGTGLSGAADIYHGTDGNWWSAYALYNVEHTRDFIRVDLRWTGT